MKAPAGADTAPQHRGFSELVVSFKTTASPRRITVCLLRGLSVSSCAWVLPEEHRNLENDFRKYVSAFCVSLQLDTFYMKVDMDLEVDSRSTPFVHPALFNAPDNRANFYPCQPVDLWTSRICAMSFTSEMSPRNASPWRLPVGVPKFS